MIDEKLNVAVEKSDLVLKKLKIRKDERMIPTKDILNAVKEITGFKISVGYTSFSEFKELDNCGAMMCVIKNDDTTFARILINSDNSPKYKRFSLVHELGHLITNRHTISSSENQFMISTHIDQNIFSLDKKVYDKDEYLLNEQIANVFALRTIIPFDALMYRLKNYSDLDEIANIFGVTKEAVISRIALGE